MIAPPNSHFHDCITVARAAGLDWFDSAVGGVGVVEAVGPAAK